MSPRPELPDLTDQWIVITGGNGHLGTSLIAALTRVNANVLIVDKQESVGPNVPVSRSGNKSEIDYYCCDLEKEEQRNSLISYISQSIGRLDSLINNAAFVGDSNLEGWSEPFDEQSLSAWRRAIEVNLTAPIPPQPSTFSLVICFTNRDHSEHYFNLCSSGPRFEAVRGHRNE